MTKFADWHAILCLDDCELVDFLFPREQSGVNPDSLRRFVSLLDKCPEWDISTPGVPDTVRVGPEGAETFAPTLGFALFLQSSGWGVACLVFGSTLRRKQHRLAAEIGEAEVFFFARSAELPLFWRSLFRLESVPEDQFFPLASDAFPRLKFHPQLSFGKFEGGYSQVRDRVVEILGILNDHFPTACQEHHGLPDKIKAVLSPFGLNLSPESPSTRKSVKLIAQRDVLFDGQPYRCEWHAKLEPHRNRIHFTLPQEALAGRMLIGIFVDHLDT